MTVPYYSCPVTRRLFIERSFQGTAAVVLSGFAVFTPPKALAAEQPSLSIDLPSPQFAAWAPDRKLLITFIAPDGSYGVMQKGRDPKDSDTFLSVGTATGQFNWPQGIAVSGSIAYIVDSNNGRIQRLDLSSRRFLKPFGGLGKKSGLLLRPRGICIFENEIFVADTRNHRIQVFSIDGVVKRIFGELGDANDQFRLPTSCAVSPQGEVFVVDSKHSVVKVFGLDGRLLRRFGGPSSSRKEPGLLNMPTGISLDPNGEIVCVADTGNSRVQLFDVGGKLLRMIEAPDAPFRAPQGVACSNIGQIAISDPEADRVWIMAV